MPFDRPTLDTLIARSSATITSRLGGAVSLLRRSVLGVLARMDAAGRHGLYGYLDWISRQIMPDTADAEIMERGAFIWGVERTGASTATGTATVSGTTGAVVPAGTVLRRADGAEYNVVSEAVLADGAATLDIQASVTGADGNLAAGTMLSLPSPVAGVVSTAVSSEVTGGADAEPDQSLLARLLARIRQAPHGGADFDYKAWALEVPGVTRAWVYPKEMGSGTVTVRAMTDGVTDDGIPASATIAALQDHLDGVRPITADVYAVAPIPVPLNPRIARAPNTAAGRGGGAAELADLLLREAEPGGTILISRLREAVSVAAGESDHVLVSPSANVTHATGEIAVLGTTTWEDI